MAGMKLSELDFLRLLPAFMRDDETAIALSKAMNKLLREPGQRLHTLRTWDKVDELTEAECDEMAWELDIDWYDSTGMGLEEKRATIKLAQQIKRKRGTKWAVERLISAYFGEGYIMEWYDTDGKPFTFVALTTNTHITAENFGKFVEGVKAAKNERSRIAGIFYFWQQGPPGVECALGSGLHRYDFKKCGIYPRIATTGFVVKSAAETKAETALYKYDVEKCSEKNPKTAIHLQDKARDKSYLLYVSNGKLTLAPAIGTAKRQELVFKNAGDTNNYSLYVQNSKLTLELAPVEAETVGTSINLYDHVTGQRYRLGIMGGKLRLA